MGLFNKKKVYYRGLLLSSNDRARNQEIQKVLNMAQQGDTMAIKTIELALRQLGAKKNAVYHHPAYGNTITYNADQATTQLINLAKKGKMLNDPALTQQLIIKSGPKQSQIVAVLPLMEQKSMLSYVLLGIHMQANIMLSQRR